MSDHLAARVQRMMDDLIAIQGLIATAAQQPACFRVDFTWKRADIKTSITITWLRGDIVSISPAGVTYAKNQYGTYTVSWQDGDANCFSADVKPGFPTPSLWRGIRVCTRDKNGRAVCVKSFTYDVTVLM